MIPTIKALHATPSYISQVTHHCSWAYTQTSKDDVLLHRVEQQQHQQQHQQQQHQHNMRVKTSSVQLKQILATH